MKGFLTIFALIITNLLFSQQMKIGVLRDYAVKKINLTYHSGSYSIYADTVYLGSILPNEFVDLSLADSNKIWLKRGVVDMGAYSKIRLIENQVNSSITLTAKSPNIKSRRYKNDFEVSNVKNQLLIVNAVDMDNYLMGVVESEGGGGRELDYYKVQGLMSRTYALKNKNRHAKEGFNLCDRVHCQAYHHMLRYTLKIDTAVSQTHNMVLLDENNELIDTYFHANCGGQTCEPDYVWNEKVPYLNTFLDTFCLYTKQANWEDRVPKEKWKDFLVEKYNYPIQDSFFLSTMYTFNQAQRMAFYISPVLGIPLRDLRENFKLKSTFFSCYPEGEMVVIQGKGYGHGVGLCQEGAMKMAKYGLNFQQICNFYFPGARIEKMDQIHYFQQQGDGKL